MEASNNVVKTEKSWLGSSIQDLWNGSSPWNYTTTPLIPSKYHYVCYQHPINLETMPKPHLTSQQDIWNDDHLRLPFLPQNIISINENGVDVNKQFWELVKKAYSKPIKNVQELEEAISTYNKFKAFGQSKFVALENFFENVLTEEENIYFFECELPSIIKLALSLPEILPSGVPLMKANHCRSVSLSQLQIASLLANAFLCTFPWRKDVPPTYPGANFVRLFCSKPSKQRVAEKIKCILHYFRRISRKCSKGVVTFERKHIPNGGMPRWDNSNNNLGNTKIHITDVGTIEDDGLGMLQVDFANKNIGGGVLQHGSVQEEIRFVICPELIVGRLFVERLGDNEAVVVLGPERYSNYSGYGDTFKWAGNCDDNTPYDEFGRRKTTIAIIDATRFEKPQNQYYPSAMLRELNKAYVGFSSREKDNLPPVATGNWGCGAFKGNSCLKALIQLMACSATNRSLVYYTFGDKELTEQFYNMHLFLANNQITIAQLWGFLHKFSSTQLPGEKLYSFVQQAYFDSKKQPQIKSFFTPKPTSQPSTSKSVDITTLQIQEPETKPESQDIEIDDIIPSSQPEEESIFKRLDTSKRRSSTKEIAKKLPKNHNDIFHLMDMIDGHMNGSSSKETTEEAQDEGLLSQIDKAKKNASTCHEEDEKMEVEEIITNLPNSETKKVKRKITEYFTKSTKSN